MSCRQWSRKRSENPRSSIDLLLSFMTARKSLIVSTTQAFDATSPLRLATDLHAAHASRLSAATLQLRRQDVMEQPEGQAVVKRQ